MKEQMKTTLAITLLAVLLTACGAGEPPASEAVVAVELSSLKPDYRIVDVATLQTAEQLNAACEAEVEAMKAGIAALESAGDGTSPGDYLEYLNSQFVSGDCR